MGFLKNIASVPTSISPMSTTPLLAGAADTSRSIGSSLYHTVNEVPAYVQASIPSRRLIIRAFLHLALRTLFELVLPFVLYCILRNFTSPLLALVLAGGTPAAVVLYTSLHDREVEMTSLLIFLGFAVAASVVLALIGVSDPRLSLLRESALTSSMGLMLILTLLPLRWRKHVLRPFMFYVARRIAVSGAAMLSPDTIRLQWDGFWKVSSYFRLFFRALTAAFGIGLLSDLNVQLFLLYTMDDDDDIMYYTSLWMLVVIVCLGVLLVASALAFKHLYDRVHNLTKLIEPLSGMESTVVRTTEEGQQLQRHLV